MTDPRVAPDRARTWLQQDLRKVAAAATAGLVCGFMVNGVGSRLAMLLLARLNPGVTGRISDDGFRMGQFTLGATGSLVLLGTAIGVFGGLVFLVVRDLRFGPTWFRVTSISVGPAVVVGSMLVHTDGVDFRILEPPALAIALFVALPALFALSVSLLTDHWTRPGAWPMRSSRAWMAGLLLLVAVLPALPILAGAAGARALHQSAPAVRAMVARPAFAIAARGLLVLAFLLSLRDLFEKVTVLT